jgi:hypothetical protein
MILVEIEEPLVPIAAKSPAVVPEVLAKTVPEIVPMAISEPVPVEVVPEDAPVVELDEEPVPTASALDVIPFTGDNSSIWFLLTILSGLAVALLANALLRKRD